MNEEHKLLDTAGVNKLLDTAIDIAQSAAEGGEGVNEVLDALKNELEFLYDRTYALTDEITPLKLELNDVRCRILKIEACIQTLKEYQKD